MKRKEFYKKYGIDFVKGKLLHPVFGPIPELLIDGNTKIGKGIYHFSQLPGTKEYKVTINNKEYTIKGTCPCDCAGCYAQENNYKRKSVVKSLAIRTLLVNKDLDFVRRALSAQIEADNIESIRIHAAGDFQSLAYVNMWKQLFIDFPQLTADWTYTKRKAYENMFDELNNANIVKSIIPNIGHNYGTCEYVINAYNALCAAKESVYICRCGIDENQHCNNCKGCFKSKYVLFIEHSTAYEAKKDPLYNTLKNIIENQPSMEG